MEAPHLSQLAERHQGDGLTVLAVNAWDEERDVITKFAREGNLKQRILLNGRKVYEETYGPKRGVPTVFWIDRGGKIVHTHLDYEEKHAKVLDQYTAELVANKP